VTTTRADRLVRSTPLEVATGWAYGLVPEQPLPKTSATPREMLDNAIRPALRAGRCYVAFSGGRDSSAVLAAATALARREDLPPPIPVTTVYPDLPDTDESDWQRLVIGHLGITNWIRLEFRSGESDLLGPAARRALKAHGLMWPPALQTQGAMYEHLEEGSLLTGEGGDAVFGMQRVTPLTVMRRRRRFDRLVVTESFKAVLPRPVRRGLIARRERSGQLRPWLRPRALQQHAKLVTADDAQQPLRYDRGTWFLNRRRFWSVMGTNQRETAAEFGLLTSDPLLDPGFLAALARRGGGWGFTGRTAVMRALFSDVLPNEVLARSTKAAFNRAVTGPGTLEFAESWDGTGVDPDLVDPDVLRTLWRSASPTMPTGMLLHSAWLASQEGGR